MTLLYFLAFCFLIRISTQSECIVSEWGTWSKCHGGCQRGLIVRNRDVLQPPLQELTEEGRMMQRLCPHLYETKYCDKAECEEEKRVNYEQTTTTTPLPVETTREYYGREVVATTESTRNLVERQMAKIGFGRDADIQTQAAIKQKFISETEQLFKLDDAINRRYGPQPSDNLVNTHSPIIDISTQQLTNKQWRDNTANKWTSAAAVSTTTPTPSYRDHLQAFGRVGGLPIHTTDSEQHHRANSRRTRPVNDHSVSNLLRKIEQALDTNQPLDEKYIKSAMKRNRKLSKLLVDAYRQRQSLMNSGALSSSSVTLPTVISPYPPSTTTTEVPAFVTAIPTTTRRYYVSTTTSPPSTTTIKPTTTSTTTSTLHEFPESPEGLVDFATTPDFYETHSTTTSPLLYWPKTGGYVPNTRKHASEITAQLYMTNEIVQTLADDPIPLDVNPDCEHNKRCCKIIKNTCSDGIDPKFVKRWYRPKGSSVCVPYHYPRCSSMEEMEELPILFEQNCQDLCFSQQEKRIAPLFTLESEDD